ncbi:MAG: UDP-N-acetylmuramoyl-L-alanine--D-glutamate ligase [Desulfovibrionaceae bacterium]|jgi:UDP-N-acetylmuramoylalanine--D-glutamate ligase|nr:UDP-N-acetylmuramoyl-L-alanine--D-glutamate ligase [Desulfovibrionaceae bacterium]
MNSRIEQHAHEYAGKTAVVVGAGGSGRAAARLLGELGAHVRVLDRDLAHLPDDFKALAAERGFELAGGAHRAEHFDGADLVIMSPGVPVAAITPLLAERGRPEIIGELELAARLVTEPIIAVTGTNGKTTTVTLAARILASVGRKVFLGGNVGTPLCEYVLTGDRADCLVLEVSSFQLQTSVTFKPWVGVLLNFSPNHLDYHADMDEYLDAKLKLFANQEEHELAVLPAAQRELLEPRLATRARVVWYAPQQRFHSAGLTGAHNQANMEAAYQACRYLGVTECEAQIALGAVEAMPNRLERVVETNGVLFVNDTKATTVEAVAAALAASDRPVRLLAGGKWKGGDFAVLRPLVREKVRAVGLYGASREIFEQGLSGAAGAGTDVELFWEETMEAAARRLYAGAAPGDAVLLSPATSSFDQYKDYQARGDDFRRIARAIATEQAGNAATAATPKAAGGAQ